MIENNNFEISTKNKLDLVDITQKINEILKNSKIKQGILNISVPHSTAAIIVEENEKGLIEDIKLKISNLFPDYADYKHNTVDNNAASHLASGFLGQNRTLPIKDKQLLKGPYQNIFFVELDGPRENRKIVLTSIGED